MEYQFKENEVLESLKNYIDSTYSKHYAEGKIQSTEFIFDNSHGTGFCIGNIIKYAQRYGKKNREDERDLYKLIHYAIMLLGKKLQEESSREYDRQMQMDMD